jgi:hypothetical protein
MQETSKRINLMAPKRAAWLNEQSLEAGQAWVNPQTLLEYRDFGDWLAGKDPLHCWRNERVEEIRRSLTDESCSIACPRVAEGETREEYFQRAAGLYYQVHQRNGQRKPEYAALSVSEFIEPFVRPRPRAAAGPGGAGRAHPGTQASDRVHQADQPAVSRRLGAPGHRPQA